MTTRANLATLCACGIEAFARGDYREARGWFATAYQACGEAECSGSAQAVGEVPSLVPPAVPQLRIVKPGGEGD